MAKSKTVSNPETLIEKTLEEIKRLLVLQLSSANVSNDDIGAALGVSYKTVERMLPKKGRAKKRD
ncbi:MAG: helix-turn-helix domain-containing protein [Candidatus Yanofskybacteria bacterium]|nr:helix-turn-helix domain-containing protein [Candidatus Yanofskybacteria bacterium]